MSREGIRHDVVALFSGFMTYASNSHLEYGRIGRELAECAQTFVLLPSLDEILAALSPANHGSCVSRTFHSSGPT
jgi:hypothetical protein